MWAFLSTELVQSKEEEDVSCAEISNTMLLDVLSNNTMLLDVLNNDTMLLNVLTNNTFPILVVVALILLTWILTRRPPGFPPGPPLLPLLGNLLSMDADPMITFRNLRQRYGDIFSIYIFNQPVIVLNGYSVLRDALVKRGDDFADRPSSFLTEYLANGSGVVFTSGAVWREHRTFSLATLKQLGMGKRTIEGKILEELSFLLKVLHNNACADFDCYSLLHNVVSNVVSSVVCDKRFEYTDPLFVKFLKFTEENVKFLKSANILTVLPAVRFLPGDLFKFKRIVKNIGEIKNEIIRPIIQNHREDSDGFDDYTTAYLLEMQRRQQQGTTTTMNEANLEECLVDLFVAGAETTGTVLCWAVVYFLNYPEVQQKCFEEIKELMGLERPPSFKDKSSLPYLEATIAEVQRCADAVPGNLPHSVREDVQFRGYTFPKGVTILPLLSSVLKDPDVWGDPENFRPERFLDNNGNFVRKEECIPFSIGRRECLGESLARMEVFLIIAGMIQKFEFVPTSQGTPSTKGTHGIVRRPERFCVKAVPRSAT